MEDAGALWTIDQPATANRVGRNGPNTTPKKAETDAKNEDGGKNEDATVPVTPRSKARNPKKRPAETPGSAVKRGRKVRESDGDGEGTAEEGASTKKKAKVAQGPITEEDEMKEGIKKEPEDGSTGDAEEEDVAEVAENA